MHGHSYSNIQDIRLLELMDAVADLFPLNAAVRQVGEAAAPELFFNWRTEGAFGRQGNFSWGVLFRFAAGAIEHYGRLEDAGRERACGELRKLAQDLRFSYDGSDARSLFIVDVPENLFRAVVHSEQLARTSPTGEDPPQAPPIQTSFGHRIPDTRDE
jgi:hypothetical protein